MNPIINNIDYGYVVELKKLNFSCKSKYIKY